MARLMGKNADVEINGAAVVGFKEWSANITSEAVDVSGFDNSGYKAYEGALSDVDISFSGTWDSSEAKIYGNPPAISAGATLSSFKGYVSASAYCELAFALVASINYSVSATGAITFNGTLKPTSLSTFTYPAAP